MSRRIIDLSHPIHTSTPPWPGCLSVEIKSLDQVRLSTPTERHSNSSRFAMNIHCGTHMDAPYHFLDSGRSIDGVSLDRTYGRATLVRLPEKGAGTHVTCEDLRPWAGSLERTGKAILRTGWASHWMQHDFFTEYPDILPDAAEFLVKCGVHLVGVETGSVDYSPNPTHIVLLGSDVLIVECLTNLDQIEDEEFLFAAIPLNLQGLDGSPVRAVAICD